MLFNCKPIGLHRGNRTLVRMPWRPATSRGIGRARRLIRSAVDIELAACWSMGLR
jgi:hypothetical protein